MSEYTPGPWRIGDAGHTVFGPKTDSPSPKIIASGLSRADAKLIHAAPELLGVLRAVGGEGPDVLANSEDRDALLTWLEAVVGQAQAAIAKTEGGTAMRGNV